MIFVKKKIVSFGEVLWDVFPDGKALGGAPLNFAYYAAKLGQDAAIISAVGDDELGAETLEKIKESGVNADCVGVLGGFSTGVSLVKKGADGLPEYEIKENAAWDNIPCAAPAMRAAAGADAFAFGTLSRRSGVSRETFEKIAAAVPQTCLKVFDANLRQNFYGKDLLLRSLDFCDVLKINETELPVLAEMFAPDSQDPAKTVFDNFNLRHLVLTLGERGFRIIYNGGEYIGKSDKIKVVDTVGAGDSFTAAFTVAILLGKGVPQAAEEAKSLAQKVCSGRGAMCL